MVLREYSHPSHGTRFQERTKRKDSRTKQSIWRFEERTKRKGSRTKQSIWILDVTSVLGLQSNASNVEFKICHLA
uniref:Uncharacterized protein n=1 Tax=Arundo donax TaxID=35708 RepID=A0A0A9CXD3_ARUDO